METYDSRVHLSCRGPTVSSVTYPRRALTFVRLGSIVCEGEVPDDEEWRVPLMENERDFDFGGGAGVRFETEAQEMGVKNEYVELEPTETEPQFIGPKGHTTPTPAQIQEGFTTVATLIGRKWHLVILDQLLMTGPLGFSALLRRIDGISSKVLSESLTDLEKNGFITRSVVSDRPFRVEYAMSARGYSLRPILDAVHVSVKEDDSH
jgi:DNA-binding HxlR family transcriptional regulator